MTIEFYKRIAFRLMRSSLAIALILGLIVALFQVVMDLGHQRQQIDNNVDEIFRVVQNSAQRAVHQLDANLANEVIKGLENYNFITYAAILDDRDQVIADYSSSPSPSDTLWLTRLIAEEIKTYQLDLIHTNNTYEGKLVVSVSNDLGFAPFYDRVLTIIVSGLLRNLSLALVLFALFHFMLTRPLVTIARRFSMIRPEQTEQKRIDHVEGHRFDELGYIVNDANSFLAALEHWQTGLTKSEQQLRLILDTSPNLVFAVDENYRFIFANNTTEQFYQKTQADLIGQNYCDVHKSVDTEEAKALASSLKQLDFNNPQGLTVEHKLTAANGDKLVIQMTFIAFTLDGKSCVLIVGLDVTTRVKAEERVEYLAYFDTLTDLPNRNLFQNFLKKDVMRANRTHTYGALLFIDFDDFKRINDTIGHSLGDELLLKLSVKIRSLLPESDTLARLGGDEFVISLPDLDKDLEEAKTQAITLTKHLLATINAPVALSNGAEFVVSGSIGLVMYPFEDSDTEVLLRFADTAMYKAKAHGRNGYQLFEESMAAEVHRHVQLESDLREAIKKKQFSMVLQPIVNGLSGDLVAAEALIRWNHPTQGLVSPNDFIPFLENSGMIVDVDYVMVDKACAFLKELTTAGVLPPHFRITLNLCANTLYQTDFVDRIIAIVASYGVSERNIEFEITERAALHRLDEVVAKIVTLQRRGATFSLDDFGTGYSSLSYLKRIPINKIKIDKSFIDDLMVDGEDEVLVESIIAIARTMKLAVVAEGVETQVQADWLNRYPDICFQGYLIDRPMTPNACRLKYMPAQSIETEPLKGGI